MENLNTHLYLRAIGSHRRVLSREGQGRAELEMKPDEFS
jgi:hypothetical protein